MNFIDLPFTNFNSLFKQVSNSYIFFFYSVHYTYMVNGEYIVLCDLNMTDYHFLL